MPTAISLVMLAMLQMQSEACRDPHDTHMTVLHMCTQLYTASYMHVQFTAMAAKSVCIMMYTMTDFLSSTALGI